MLFTFGPHSGLLLPFVVPGAAATLWLLVRAWRRGSPPDALLALLILVPTLSVSQWMLGYAGWFDSHDGYSTVMFYVPWRAGMVLGGAYYLYFQSLTNQDFRWRPALKHLLPGLLEWGAFAAVALYDLVWWRGVRGRPLPDFFGTKGAGATLLDETALPAALLSSALLLGYGLRLLADYRRYRHYLNDNFSDPERLRFAGLRQLLALQALVLVLSVVFTVLNQIYDFSYDAAWYFFALRGVLIYGLIVVGIQANYAAATSSLRFGAAPKSVAETELFMASAPVPAAVPMAPAAAVDTPVASAAPVAEETALPITTEPAASVAAPAPELTPELLPWREKLLRLMAEEQPWLEPELTLTELAHRLRTHPALLSKVINAGCGQNFNDFVNTYRVQEARRKLADPRFAHYSLVGVALESGFNSKSTFNRVFKKLLGQAPSEVERPKS
ncbi:helix-turn-helix transcriptional regulator [Hymenobacter properus]|uniref:Helix-turn-helix transcriptional regulator n=1 Tax=Hymenobacter properus TaxID=2791026 RepID=A0A931BLW1_9BACT|nr:helix-turn-helix transcriptional regulator [Hymenobacter properus]MBF9143782.1 helix-turn-helix transcriptional regulator [Hymenobacter properus]MBR7722595.1 helix-turn-helix transcriptional regulator [Microvirga sp. SRT04]